MDKKGYVSPVMACVAMDGLQVVCQSNGVTGNGDVVSGVGYGGVDEGGTVVPSTKEFNNFNEELDRIAW